MTLTGQGTKTMTNGDWYRGYFNNGALFGSGKFTTENFQNEKQSVTIEGNFQNSSPSGQCTLTTASRKFTGFMVDFIFTRDITIEYQEGERQAMMVYEGTVKGLLRHGKGKVTCEGQVFYEGDWMHDKRHGKAIVYDIKT